MSFDEKALHEVRQTRFLINRVDDWIYDEIAPYIGQRVLEVGCGLGNLFPRLLDRELVYGIDISEESINELQRTFAHTPNVQACVCDICAPNVLHLSINAFDTIISLNVLEHIVDDNLAFANMRKLLAGSGHLIIIVPAHRWLYGTMDSSIGHFRRYDKEQMRVKLTQAGFEIITQQYLNFAGALGWLVSGKILRKKTPPANQLRLFNLLVPFLQYVETKIESPVGVSLLSVAR